MLIWQPNQIIQKGKVVIKLVHIQHIVLVYANVHVIASCEFWTKIHVYKNVKFTLVADVVGTKSNVSQQLEQSMLYDTTITICMICIVMINYIVCIELLTIQL